MTSHTMHFQCVYGEEDVRHIEDLLLPSLEIATKSHVVFHVLNFSGQTGIIKPTNLTRITIVQHSNLGRQAGFGENHNKIFSEYEAGEYFFLLNPDCILDPASADLLAETFSERENVGIVEARQWPFELTKPYNEQTLETSWAAAAFVLVHAPSFREIGGFDEAYFLYSEDVDLSWSMWQIGRRVLYQPAAAFLHFTGSRHYQYNFTSLEWFFAVRNHLYLARKFFGAAAGARARREVHRRVDVSLAKWAVRTFLENQEALARSKPAIQTEMLHPMVRMTGLGGYGRQD
jgi:hypothetical protein